MLTNLSGIQMPIETRGKRKIKREGEAYLWGERACRNMQNQPEAGVDLQR